MRIAAWSADASIDRDGYGYEWVRESIRVSLDRSAELVAVPILADQGPVAVTVVDESLGVLAVIDTVFSKEVIDEKARSLYKVLAS